MAIIPTKEKKMKNSIIPVREEETNQKFSEEYGELIKRAHPYVEKSDLPHLLDTIDRVAEDPEKRELILCHLRGRAFGYTGGLS